MRCSSTGACASAACRRPRGRAMFRVVTPMGRCGRRLEGEVDLPAGLEGGALRPAAHLHRVVVDLGEQGGLAGRRRGRMRGRRRGPDRPRRASSRSSSSAAIAYSRLRVVREHRRVVGVDGHRHAGRDQRGQRVFRERRHRPGARHWTSGRSRAGCRRRRDAPAAPRPARRRCRARCARRRAGRARPRSCPARWTRRRAGRCAARRPAPRRSAAANCARGTPSSGPPRPKLTSPSGRSCSAMSRVTSAAGDAGLAGDVEAPAQLRCRSPRSAAAPGVLDRLAERLGRRCRAMTDEYGVQGQLGVADVLRGQVARDLVGQRPDVLGVADQVDDREVDVDEVREVGEREVLGQQLRVGRHRRAPACRAASSATIRGDAEPTWCTCSSALGRPAMNSVVAIEQI